MDPGYVIEVPFLGNRWSVGLAFQLHLAIVAFIAGIAVLAPLAEWWGARRQDPRWDRFAHGLSSTIVKLYSFGATWAVFALVLLIALYPRLLGVLLSLFFPMAVAIALLWLVMTASAYAYYFTWARPGRRGLHLASGWTFLVTTLAFITLASGMAAYQLAPNDASSFPRTLLTATWLPQSLHRHLGNLSYAGLLLAGYGGLRLLFLGTGPAEKREYFDWLADVGVLVGIGVMLAQPLAGAWYAFSIRSGSPAAFRRAFAGEYSWLMLLQTALLGGVFFCANLYFARSARRADASASITRWLRRSVLLFAAAWALAIVPRVVLSGPWRYFGIATMALVTAANLALHVRTRPSIRWGAAGRGASGALVTMALLAVALLTVMGIVRSSARGKWLIHERMPREAAQRYEPEARP